MLLVHIKFLTMLVLKIITKVCIFVCSRLESFMELQGRITCHKNADSLNLHINKFLVYKNLPNSIFRLKICLPLRDKKNSIFIQALLKLITVIMKKKKHCNYGKIATENTCKITLFYTINTAHLF